MFLMEMLFAKIGIYVTYRQIRYSTFWALTILPFRQNSLRIF